MNKDKIIELIKDIRNDKRSSKELLQLLINLLDLRQNPFHPLVFIDGYPKIGNNVGIGLFSEIYAQGSEVTIGDNCDIASFVSINVSDSHKKCIGIAEQVERKPIVLEQNVFIGSHCFIGGGTYIGHNSVVGAGTILINAGHIPPYSLIIGNPAKIKKGYFLKSNKHNSDKK